MLMPELKNLKSESRERREMYGSVKYEELLEFRRRLEENMEKLLEKCVLNYSTQTELTVHLQLSVSHGAAEIYKH